MGPILVRNLLRRGNFTSKEHLKQACLAIDAVVAWRIHHLTYLGRATPELPCTAVFVDHDWKAVTVFQTHKPPPEQPPSLRAMIRAIARLGGFLGRKSDGEPGTQSLW